MTYTCEDCGFAFSRVSDVKECPSCEGNHIRPATGEERDALQARLEKQSVPARDRREADFGEEL